MKAIDAARVLGEPVIETGRAGATRKQLSAHGDRQWRQKGNVEERYGAINTFFAKRSLKGFARIPGFASDRERYCGD